MQFADKDGTMHYPIMGCYGIGIGRLAASVCEARHDEYEMQSFRLALHHGRFIFAVYALMIWRQKSAADHLYEELTKQKVEVLYDDREGSPGRADVCGRGLNRRADSRDCQSTKFKR